MGRSGDDRIVTVPNVLSVGRLLCVPVFLWLLFGREDRYAAGLLLAALGITDCADGWIARHFHQESRLGKVLDPTADRLLLGVGVVALLLDGSMPQWVGALAAVREAAVGLAVVALAALGAREIIDVKLVGKAGTLLLMVAFPLFLASNPDGGAPWHEVARPLAWVTAIPGLLLSWYAAATYVPAAREALERSRAARAARGAKAAG
ncbi:MAG: CDP-alcohol phosphatidyltransferase family protein [Actinomycetota bacterium]|nr:CDP-alcohol phosphatidyltransferase family protein [Actinomycetota bacterium]